MRGALPGTFVLSWSQTSTDGAPGAPLTALRVGAIWSWTGEPTRVDGPRDVLVLGDPVGSEDLRARAAQRVQRSLRAPTRPKPTLEGIPLDESAADARGTVTDGRATYTFAMIDGPTGTPLILFAGSFPPKDCGLWVVHLVLPKLRHAGKGAGVICFTPGTMIEAEGGPRAIEELVPGDKIQTRDSGLQELIWTGSRRITGARMHVMPHLRPVRVHQSALGAGRPDADLLVSGDHRLLVRGSQAQTLFNTDEVLVAAKDLVDHGTVYVDLKVREVTYIHLMTEAHEVIIAIATTAMWPAMPWPVNRKRKIAKGTIQAAWFPAMTKVDKARATQTIAPKIRTR